MLKKYEKNVTVQNVLFKIFHIVFHLYYSIQYFYDIKTFFSKIYFIIYYYYFYSF